MNYNSVRLDLNKMKKVHSDDYQNKICTENRASLSMETGI